MDISMLIPLLMMALSFKLYYGAVVLMRARAELLERDRNARWVQELIEGEAK
jgi:heme exporter protein C